MEKTTNYKLYKPSYDDDVDIQILNNNMDILDDNLKRNNDKFKQYLPLSGGTMQGDIILPYNIWKGLRSVRNDEEYLSFNETSFKTVKLPTLCTKSSRFKFYYNDDDAFTIDNTGVWFNNDEVPHIVGQSLSATHGYTKSSNGLTLQWGYVSAGANDGNVQHVTFETPMKNTNYLVFVSKSNYIEGKPPTDSGVWYSATYNFTSTGFDVICDSNDTAKFWFWFAIGTNA